MASTIQPYDIDGDDTDLVQDVQRQFVNAKIDIDAIDMLMEGMDDRIGFVEEDVDTLASNVATTAARTQAMETWADAIDAWANTVNHDTDNLQEDLDDLEEDVIELRSGFNVFNVIVGEVETNLSNFAASIDGLTFRADQVEADLGMTNANLLTLENSIDDLYEGLSLVGDNFDNYVTHPELTTTLGSYVSSTALSSTLSGYVLSSALSTALNSYVTSSALTTALAPYATTASLGSYVTSSSLTSTLSGYVSSSALTTALSSYVTSSTLTSTLSNYVTNSSLTSTLSSYHTTAAFNTAIAAYSTTAQMNAAIAAVALTPATPNARTLSFATAYQATDNTKPAFISAMIDAAYTLTLAGTLADTVNLVIGPTNAVASGTGTVIASFRSSLTGIALSIGMGLGQRNQLSAVIPAGWYFAFVRTQGTTATIQSAFDQKLIP